MGDVWANVGDVWANVGECGPVWARVGQSGVQIFLFVDNMDFYIDFLDEIRL